MKPAASGLHICIYQVWFGLDVEIIMSAIIARTGRHRQRYEDNLRLVSGSYGRCIPYRLAKYNENWSSGLEYRIEVLMISSPKRDDLVFPKGGWEDDETVEEAACREALEEAGVRGILKENPLGMWEFRSKSKQDMCSLEGGCRGYMFALEVTEELDVWPEQGDRDRKWLVIKEAFKLCRYEWMRRALEEFLRIMAMAEDGKHEMREEAMEPHPVPDSDCQIMSTSCYVNSSGAQLHNVSPMSQSFGIMLPGILF
ncbi:unnamed protein product [Ilex paraguariensis]|uniref:Nudix hydrolase domain-containing protein n=1 Tax=Ilex paraguariensis TaxID=185542 RepID=A0ABC8TFY1_9AQUA